MISLTLLHQSLQLFNHVPLQNTFVVSGGQKGILKLVLAIICFRKFYLQSHQQSEWRKFSNLIVQTIGVLNPNADLMGGGRQPVKLYTALIHVNNKQTFCGLLKTTLPESYTFMSA